MDSKRGNRIDNGKGIPKGAKLIQFKPNRKRILQNASYIQSKNCIDRILERVTYNIITAK